MKPTKKYQAAKASYNVTRAEIYGERDHCCEGCGTWQGPIACSHRIPVSKRPDLRCDKDNIDLMCHPCHELVETGKYDDLANGKAIHHYIAEIDPQYLQEKLNRRDFLAA